MSRQPTKSPLPSATKPLSAPSPSASGPAKKPTADQVRKRAYELYLARRGVGGSPDQDWVKAERELIQELNGR